MKNYLSILKILLKNNSRASRNKYIDGTKTKRSSDLLNIIGIVIGFGVLIAMICCVFFVVSVLCAIEGLSRELLSLILTLGQIMIIFFGMNSVLSNTFFARDNEFLSYLPVKSATVFGVKMTVVYLNELLVSTLFMLPLLIAYIAGTIIGGIAILPQIYLFIPLILLTQPIIPLVILSLLSFPLIKIIGYFKNKSSVTLIASIVTFSLLMAAYMALIPNIDKIFTPEGQASLLTPQFKAIIVNVSKVFYNSAFSNALFGNRFWVNMLIYISTISISMGITVGLSALLFSKSASKSNEETLVKKRQKSVSTKIHGIKKTLFVRESRSLLRNQNVAFNSIMGSIMTPLLIVVFQLIGIINPSDVALGGQILSAFAEDFIKTGFLLFYCIFLMCGTNYTAGLSFSREGNTFYILRYLPVTVRDIVKSKINLANVVSSIGIIAVTIITFALIRLKPSNAFPMLFAIALYSYAFNILGVYRDLKKPNINWTNAYEVIKKNIYPAIPMFYALGIGMLIMLAASAIVKYENSINLTLAVILFWVAIYLVGIIIIAVLSFILKRDSQKLFDRIDC